MAKKRITGAVFLKKDLLFSGFVTLKNLCLVHRL